jgi:hypothetical protein
MILNYTVRHIIEAKINRNIINERNGVYRRMG